LLTLALRRGLAPLSQAADDVAARSVESLHPIAFTSQPIELHRLIGAINDLMARLGSALALQRHFVADAAHELRTPITALRLQLQLLERAKDEARRACALQELRAGVARTQHMVEQLLQLSRLGPEASVPKLEALDLAELSRAGVMRFNARAEELGIDLGAAAAEPVPATGDAQQINVLLDNLIDNALLYTPRGGKVDVSALWEGQTACLIVADNGPGIPADERERVFDRFYRSVGSSALGSGLGLAIVRTVAQRHGAEVTLADAAGGGLLVRVCFPR
jgi:signal transduction histidine kinase